MKQLGVSIVGGVMPWQWQMDSIAETGFDCTFFDWNEDGKTAAWADYARGKGLFVDSLHAPFGRINSFWEDTAEGQAYFERMLTVVRDCADAQIPKLVMHTTVGNNPPETCELGFVRYRTMCDLATQKGVHICFENLEPFVHLHEILRAVDDPFHGFCWDCGHNLCYTPHVDMMALYEKRLMCLHLHDNYGVTQPGNIDYRDDLHMLPFEGVLDWNWVAEKIAHSGYAGPLTFEFSTRTIQQNADKSYQEFLQSAMQRAVRLRSMVENIKTV